MKGVGRLLVRALFLLTMVIKPRAPLFSADIDDVIAAFRRAAERALASGFELIEIHGAHGYLLHEFLSPFSNIRTDELGGSLENRMRLALRVTHAVREVWPARLPLFFRLSATDWQEGGWDLEQSIELARRLKSLGVDVIDVSSGGNLPHAKIPVGPGYQVPFSASIRKQAGIPTTALGMITDTAASRNHSVDRASRLGGSRPRTSPRSILASPRRPADEFQINSSSAIPASLVT